MSLQRRPRPDAVAATRLARREWLLQMLAFGAAACGRRIDDPAHARGSTVVMAIPGPGVLQYDAWGFDSLTFLTMAKEDARGELVPHLAQRWEHSADHREYTYHLRTDVRWDDGVPVTAHDVKFTSDLLNHPDVASGGPDVEVIDDFTVRILGGPDSLVYPRCLPRHVLESCDPKRFWQWDFWTRRVGCGPFRFRREIPQTMVEYERNPDYYGARPRIERVILKFVGEAGLTELLAGSVDMARADPTQIPRIADDGRFRIYQEVSHGAWAIHWKCNHALFSDARVRRALTLAIDRQELLRLMNFSPDLPITDGVFTRRQFRRREWPEPLPYDPGRARALLDAAGWMEPREGGMREKQGRAFRFTAIVNSSVGVPKLAVYVQALFRSVGVQMDIQLSDAPSMWRVLRAGDFEAWMHVAQPGVGAQERDFGRGSGRGNTTGYENQAVYDVIDRLRATADPDEEDSLYRQLTEIYRADVPFTRLIPFTLDWFVHRRIGGLSTPFRALPDEHLAELWVEGRS